MDVYMRRRLVAGGALALVVILIIVAIASGGDDDDGEITPLTGATGQGSAATTKDDFIADADAICLETSTALANLDSGVDADEATLAEQELDITESQLDQLRSLSPPEEDQRRLDRFFGALEDLVAALEKQQLAAERNETATLAEAGSEVEAAKAAVAAAADRYGFRDCGEEGRALPGDSDDGGTAGAATTPATTTPEATTPPATTAPATPTAPAGGGTSAGGGGGGTSSGGGGGGGGGGGSSGGVTP